MVVLYIRKYGSTFYIGIANSTDCIVHIILGIAIVIFPYNIGTMGKLKHQNSSKTMQSVLLVSKKRQFWWEKLKQFEQFDVRTIVDD